MRKINMSENGQQTKISANERSEGGELISYMNEIFGRRKWKFKSAVGELSVESKNSSDNRYKALFPDAIVFADKDNLVPVVSWEFKMPDTPIDDDELYSNAIDKANRLGTNVAVLWNFQYCYVYYRNGDGKWSRKPNRTYDQYSEIMVDRNSVDRNKKLWKDKAKRVLEDLNADLVNNLYKVAPIQFNIGNYIDTISETLTPLVTNYLLSLKKPTLMAEMQLFARKEQSELNSLNSKNLTNAYVARTYAKNIVIRWINRIIFSNMIRTKYDQLSAVLADFLQQVDIGKFGAAFNEVVKETDFFSILHVNNNEMLLPQEVTSNLTEFCHYLWNAKTNKFDATMVSKILEALVSVTKHKLMGLYTTPQPLAQLLVSVTMQNVTGDYADFTVGSGTIAKEIIDNIRQYQVPMADIHDHVWASDKYSFPLQVANFNMTSYDSLNLMNIVFKHNALSLSEGEKIKVVDPNSGELLEKHLPAMDAIMSNLPFISSNNRSKDDKALSADILKKYGLDKKADLYQTILLHYKSLLKSSDDARIGVITSNSWFKNGKGKPFFEVLSNIYDVKYVIYSDVSRWFDNADVVATIIVVANKSVNPQKTRFLSLQKDIRKLDSKKISNIANQILAGNEVQAEDLTDYSYSLEEITKLLNTGICVEALFDDLSWLDKVVDAGKLAPITNFCNIARGSRTGGDDIFITDGCQTDAEDSHPYIKSIKNVDSLIAQPTGQYFFYTTDSIDELKAKGHKKTLNYIQSVSHTIRAEKQRKKHGDRWYVAEDRPKYGDFVTSVNPDKRWFWAAFNTPTAFNQRVAAAILHKEYSKDKELIHALLNSVIPIYIMCGAGFARADGVTDLTANGMKKLSILNPDLLSDSEKGDITHNWEQIKHQKAMSIFDELEDPEWIAFNKVVLKAYNIDPEVYDQAKKSIYKLLNRRTNIKDSKKK